MFFCILSLFGLSLLPNFSKERPRNIQNEDFNVFLFFCFSCDCFLLVRICGVDSDCSGDSGCSKWGFWPRSDSDCSKWVPAEIDFQSPMWDFLGQKIPTRIARIDSDCSKPNNWLSEVNYCNNWLWKVNFCNPSNPSRNNNWLGLPGGGGAGGGKERMQKRRNEEGRG